MRRTRRFLVTTSLVTTLLVVAALLAGSTVARADELPPGFTDGRPVGEEIGGPPIAGREGAPTATTQRYFGDEAFAAVQASALATTRTCPISDDGLTALVLSPVFKESSAATTADTAPAPMTLSRYDEWNGVLSDSQGTPENNYGLYAFRDPNTTYTRAFWHPGIGVWQYDPAGLGAPLTTIEAMDVGTVSADVARIMAAKYCSPSTTLIGHGPPFTAQEQRDSAWSDWGYPCTLCQGYFDEMMGSTPHFANLHMVAGISALGGVEERTCTLEGVVGTLPCWHVDPSVGVIQGATAWATLTPLDGGSNTVAPTPISLPFYVVDRGATEQRHWLRHDTGYGIDISASRTIGVDARPRSTQPGSGLTWASSSGLCDLTAEVGSCLPVPPAGVTSARLTDATAGYEPVALDANGDGKGDVLWYRPGAGTDALWTGAGGAAFESTAVSVGGVYDDVLTGDIDGDGKDDVLWYQRSSGLTYLWRSNGNGTFTTVPLSPGAGLQPMLLDVNGDGDKEIFWYGPGSLADAQWDWTGTAFTSTPQSVVGAYQPVVGDFDGNFRDDILWYAPGTTGDYLWLHASNGSVVSSPRTVSGTYEPLVGDLDGDHRDDIVWYAVGTAADVQWFGAPLGAFASSPISVNGSYVPFVADPAGTGRASVFWYAPGSLSDFQWSWASSRLITSTALALSGLQVPIVGGFSAGGSDGVVWYEPDQPTDVIWYH